MAKTCINLNDPDFQANIAVLTSMNVVNPVFEAARDYLQYDYIRTPEEIAKKFESVVTPISNFQEEPVSLTDVDENITAIQDFLFPNLRSRLKEINQTGTAAANNNADANILVKQLLKKLSGKTGVSYEVLTKEQAGDLLGSRYTGQTAFFYQGRVYIVSDNLSTQTAFHEFTHPVIRAIAKGNPVLFDNLYKQASVLSSTTMNENGEYLTMEEVFKSMYPEVDPNSEEFKEELIVFVVSEAANTKYETKKPTEGLLGVVKEIMFHIKQFLRTIFGKKITVSKLGPNTTLMELAEMLANDTEFEIDLDTVTSEDISEMTEEERRLAAKLKTQVSNSVIAGTIVNMHASMTSLINKLKENPNYWEIHSLLRDPHDKSYIKEIQSKLSSFVKDATPDYLKLVSDLDEQLEKGSFIQDIKDLRSMEDPIEKLYKILRYLKDHKRITKDEYDRMYTQVDKYKQELLTELHEFEKDLTFEKRRAEALLETIFTMNEAAKKMQSQLHEYANNPTKSAVRKTHYYVTILEYWDKQFRKLKDELGVMGVEYQVISPLNETLDNIGLALKESKKIYKVGARDLIVPRVTEWQNQLDEKFERQLKKYKDGNMPQNLIDNLIKNYNEASIINWDELKQSNETIEEAAKRQGLTVQKLKEKGLNIAIEKYLQGELGDAHALNSFFEGYMYNQDPVIASFAGFVKDNFTDALVAAQEKFEEFRADVMPSLIAVGYNPTNISKLGDDLLFLDTVGYIDPKTGKYEERKVWTFLNPNKDWRYEYSRRTQELETLKRNAETTNDEDMRKIYDTALENFEKWRQKYFYQEYSSEIYKLEEKYFSSLDGKEAKRMEKSIIEQLNALDSSDADDKYVLKDLLLEQKRNLANLYYPDGSPKTGQAERIAKILIAYREEKEKYYEYVPINNAWENSYNKFKRKEGDRIAAVLTKQGLDPKSETWVRQYNLMFDKAEYIWLRENTRVKLTKEFWAEKTRLSEELKKINDQIVQTDDYLKKRDKLFEEKNEILRPLKDESYQYDISKLDPEKRKRLNEIDKELEKLNEEDKVQSSGLTGKEEALKNKYLSIKRLIKLKNQQIAYEKYMSGKSTKKEYQLSNDESFELDALIEEYGSNPLYDQSDEDELLKLQEKEEKGKLSDDLKQRRREIYKEQNNLYKYEASLYYMDEFDAAVNNIQDNKLKAEFWDAFGSTRRTLRDIKDIDAVYESPLFAKLLKDKEFKKWFDANHKLKRDYGAETELKQKTGKSYVEPILRWQRNDELSYIVPLDPKYAEGYNPDAMIDNIPRVPAAKYYRYKVKDKYTTKRKEGKTVNNRGQWLPKSLEDMQEYHRQYPNDFVGDEQWDRFINYDYYNLQKNNPNLFKVLEKFTHHLLETQKKMGNKAKVYLDLPRFNKSGWEAIRGMTKEQFMKNNPISVLVQRIRNFFSNVKSGYLDDQGFKDEVDLVNLDAFDDEISGVPIAGIHWLEPNLVQKDVINSLMRYMQSAEKHKKILEMLPVGKSLVEALTPEEGSGIKEKTKVDKRSYIKKLFDDTVQLRFLSKKGENTRLKTINNIIAREFEGQTQAGFTAEMGALNKFSRLIFGKASFGFFAFNIPSALKNNLGQQFQAMLHAVGGGDYNFKDLAFGTKWGTEMAFKISTNIYNKGDLPWQLLLIEAMDPAQGRTSKKHGDRLSRTFAKDLFSKGILYNTREWLQLQAQLEVFGACMHAKKIKKMNPDGSYQEISYLDAWEVKEVVKEGIHGDVVAKVLTLKEGIDPEWAQGNTYHEYTTGDTMESIAKKYGITVEELESRNNIDEIGALKEGTKITVGTGRNFKKFVNRQHDIQNKLAGAYAPWEQPEANRYLLFRLVSYLRKYFTRMFMYRFQMKGRITNPVERYNMAYGDLEMGWYIQGMRAILRSIATKGQYLKVADKEEKVALYRMIIELAGLVMLGFIIPLLFGWDPDDEDKYEKLREKSGSMPFLFAPGDEEHEFDPLGFLANHALLMSMQVRQENEAFIPFPGFGADDYMNLANLASIAYGPTIESYVKMGNSFLHIGDDSGYYKRDTGPYIWQQEGGFKGAKYLASAFGFTGSTLDPVTAIRNYQSFRSRGL